MGTEFRLCNGFPDPCPPPFRKMRRESIALNSGISVPADFGSGLFCISLFPRPQQPKSKHGRDDPAEDNYGKNQTENRGDCGGICGALGPREYKAKSAEAEKDCDDDPQHANYQVKIRLHIRPAATSFRSNNPTNSSKLQT
jgi:hypothetical protein